MDEMQNDDYKLSPCGRLGGKTGVSQSGNFLGEFNETEDALKFVSEHMEQEQYWPNIWWVSDHGNAWMIDKDGNEIKQDEEE
jgi:hypothetical protein